MTYSYDLLGRMTGASQPGHALTFSYDGFGHQLTESGPLGTVTRTYDAAGRRTSLSASNGYYLNYDHLVTGELSAVRDYFGGAIAAYGYDALGRRTSLGRFNGTAMSWGYDGVGRLTSMSDDVSGTADDRAITLAYNPAGQIVGRTDSNDAYAFTALANQNVSDTHNGLNQVVTSGTASVGHDARGNTVTIGAGSYSYDLENRMVTGPNDTTFSYDPLGRLYQVSGASGTERYLYDNVQLMGVYNPGAVTFTEHVVHGPDLDTPLVTYTATAESWHHADERGTIVARSNGSGTVTAINRYDEYGLPQGALAGRFGYTGQMWLPQIGMFYYRARVYNPGPVAGPRFMQTDPVGYEDGINLYAYVGNDPINSFDPNGTTCNVFTLSGVFCRRALMYARADAHIEEKTRFFAAASATMHLFGSFDMPLARAYRTFEFDNTMRRLSTILNRNNIDLYREAVRSSLSPAELDSLLVHREQSVVQNFLDDMRRQDSDLYDRTISDANGLLNGGGGFFESDQAYARIIDGVRNRLGRDIDFANQGDREAIGNAVITHVKITGGCDVNGSILRSC